MGGAETLVTNYALHINKQKFDIVLVTIAGRLNTINERKLEEAGIKVVYLGDKVAYPNTTNLFKRIINMIHRFVLFAQVVKHEKPDIIHTHLHTNRYILPINTRRRNIKLFYTIHSEINVLFKSVTEKMITKYCITRKRMTPIALHTKMQRKANRFFNINNCLVVPNAINIKRFKEPKVNKQGILDELKINQDAFILGHVGRFAKVKNHEFLIDIFKKVIQRIPEAHLILIGTGNLEDQIKEKVRHSGFEESVRFLGNREDIAELMSIMDVFIFPSLHEGFGNVLIEAQAAGIRCIVSDRVPSEAILTNLVTTLSLDDPIESWVQAIVNKEKPKEVVGSVEKHDIENVIREVEKIYME